MPAAGRRPHALPAAAKQGRAGPLRRVPDWRALGVFVLASAMGGTAVPARADCENGIALLSPRIARVADARLRSLLQSDLRQAERELWEFDEVECAIVLEHAERLLTTGI